MAVQCCMGMFSGHSGTKAAAPRPCPSCPAGPPSSPARGAPLLSKGEHPGMFLNAKHLHRFDTKHVDLGFVYIQDIAPS